MELKHQVCTPEQGKLLRELGVTAEPYLFWWQNEKSDPFVTDWASAIEYPQLKEIAPAYSVAELGRMINSPVFVYASNEMADTLAGDLIIRIEKGTLSPEEANKRLNS